MHQHTDVLGQRQRCHILPCWSSCSKIPMTSRNRPTRAKTCGQSAGLSWPCPFRKIVRMPAAVLECNPPEESSTSTAHTLPANQGFAMREHRVIWFGPSEKLKVASCRNGMVTAPLPGPAAAARSADFPTSRCRCAPHPTDRTTIWKRRSPSNTSPAARPPMAMPMTSCTSARLRPRRAISPLSILISRNGRPVDLLDLDVVGAVDPAQNAGDLTGHPQHRAETRHRRLLTAKSSRTPAISSLKRIWIGCEKPILLPGNFDASASSSRIKSSLDRSGSGHSFARLENDVRVGRVRRHRIGRQVGGAGTRKDKGDLWKAAGHSSRWPIAWPAIARATCSESA